MLVLLSPKKYKRPIHRATICPHLSPSNGNSQVDASLSIAGSDDAIFMPHAIDRFMEMAVPDSQPNMQFPTSEPIIR